ncbi:RodZ domain-containing protein [Jeotgalibacillus sp. S-D1]|uniref:helix-turn-helix domain-containing protein n=1 Tax=Jeotgalibacillus sp. S-D1 TaxID=2552189 RepID=UPI0014045F7A|nr:RodZ domain-containing protein [Jeotgalibacillus sp. S-D1]
MTELGARLKEARENKGYSLEEVQALTKIQKRYLQGIEEGDYSMMPGSFYVRAFIKQYAEAVGLSSEELFETYSNDIPSNRDEQIPTNLSRSNTRKSSGGSSSNVLNFIPTAFVVIVIIGIAFVIWLVAQAVMGQDEQADAPGQEDTIGIEQPDGAESQEENAEEVEEVEETPAEEEEKQESSEELAVENTGVEGDTTNYQISNAEEVEVTVTSPETWVGITDQSGETLLGQPLTEGDTINFNASEYEWFRIRIGNTTDTVVKINDKEVPFGNESTTQNMIFVTE